MTNNTPSLFQWINSHLLSVDYTYSLNQNYVDIKVFDASKFSLLKRESQLNN